MGELGDITMTVLFQTNPATRKHGIHTLCTVYVTVPEQGDFQFDGVSRCNKRDVYNKRLGRKLALRRATENMVSDWASMAWSQYYKVYEPKPKPFAGPIVIRKANMQELHTWADLKTFIEELMREVGAQEYNALDRVLDKMKRMEVV